MQWERTKCVFSERTSDSITIGGTNFWGIPYRRRQTRRFICHPSRTINVTSVASVDYTGGGLVECKLTHLAFAKRGLRFHVTVKLKTKLHPDDVAYETGNLLLLMLDTHFSLASHANAFKPTPES